ncbi:MAG: hypothetical protein ACOVRN_07390 [Flavobacterium sp.]
MNLTKGKITKLYNKQRQSRRKQKHSSKSSHKQKTFRPKRRLNLANKTLKQYRRKSYNGGETAKLIEDPIDTIIPPNIDESEDGALVTSGGVIFDDNTPIENT